MKSGRASSLGPYLLVSLVMLAPEAWAYLDPSTGSMILSAVVGMFATAALAVKTYWYKLKALFRRRGADSPGEGQKVGQGAGQGAGNEKPSPDSKPAAD